MKEADSKEIVSADIAQERVSLQDTVRSLLEFKLTLLKSQKECQKIVDEMRQIRSNLISAKIKRIE